MLTFSSYFPESTMLVYFAEGIAENKNVCSYLEKIYRKNKPIIDNKTRNMSELKHNYFSIYRFSEEVKLKTLWKTLVYISQDKDLENEFTNEMHNIYPSLTSGCKKQDINIIYRYSSCSSISILHAAAVICFLMEKEHGPDITTWDNDFYEFVDFLNGRAGIMQEYYSQYKTDDTIPKDMSLFHEICTNWYNFAMTIDNCSAIMRTRDKNLPIILKTKSAPIVENRKSDKFELVADDTTMIGQLMCKYGVYKVADVIRTERMIEHAFKIEGLSFADFFVHYLKPRDVNISLNECFKIEELEVKDKNHDNVSAYLFTIWIRNILKEYKQAKKEASRLIESKKAHDKSLNDKMVELQEELDFLKKENSKLKSQMSEYREEINKEKKKLISKLEFENLQLKNQVDRINKATHAIQEENKLELEALRTFMFKLELEHEDVLEEDSRTKLLDAINGKKIVVFGGPDPFIIKMRGIYKDILFYSGKNKNLDTSAITKNADFVFIYTNHMVHALYYKLINSCRSNGTKYGYLGYRQNPKYIEKEMLEYLL